MREDCAPVSIALVVPRALLVALLVFALSCSSSGKPHDGGTGSTSTSPGKDTPIEMPISDLCASGWGRAAGVPKAFRFDNRTDHAVYLPVEGPVSYGTQAATGRQAFSYFKRDGLQSCDHIQNGQLCCVETFSREALYVISPGQSLSVPWNGCLYQVITGPCSGWCKCAEATNVTSGSFRAEAKAYAEYQCQYPGCESKGDGIIDMAAPKGMYTSITVSFDVPYPRDEVVLSIMDSLGDAGAVSDVSPDSTRPDVPPWPDTGTKPMVVGPNQLMGGRFQIVASESDDAGISGTACGLGKPGAVYQITFSPDATMVVIERVDGAQEGIITGHFQSEPWAPMNYFLDNTYAGGYLSIEGDATGLVASLVVYGSGFPVLWCIHSPMRAI